MAFNEKIPNFMNVERESFLIRIHAYYSTWKLFETFN